MNENYTLKISSLDGFEDLEYFQMIFSSNLDSINNINISRDLNNKSICCSLEIQSY